MRKFTLGERFGFMIIVPVIVGGLLTALQDAVFGDSNNFLTSLAVTGLLLAMWYWVVVGGFESPEKFAVEAGRRWNEVGTDARGAKIVYGVRPPVTDDELNALFADVWPEHLGRDFVRSLKHSLAYLCAYSDGTLVGFVNVAWDGNLHAFILDPTVHSAYQRRGIGSELVRRATEVARSCGAAWLHVDYEPELQRFYERCGFRPTAAGLRLLTEPHDAQPGRLHEESFSGMWSDREDMHDSTSWVRAQRERDGRGS